MKSWQEIEAQFEEAHRLFARSLSKICEAKAKAKQALAEVEHAEAMVNLSDSYARRIQEQAGLFRGN